jgi:LDH2 family malate/lactate/ureidoglycolate dehydrogenase
MAVAGVRNTNHFVAAAPYVGMAAEAGLIGFACSNALPLLAPTGGRTRTFGTNPFAYGLPSGRYHPVVLDVASSAIAAAKVPIAAREGRSLPEGLLTDSTGRPSTECRSSRRSEPRLTPTMGSRHPPSACRASTAVASAERW